MYLQLRHEVRVEHLHYGANPGWQVVGDIDFLEVHDVVQQCLYRSLYSLPVASPLVVEDLITTKQAYKLVYLFTYINMYMCNCVLTDMKYSNTIVWH